MTPDGSTSQTFRSDHLIFVHEHRAAYPEIAAYREYFADRYVVNEMTPAQAEADPHLAQAISWHMMGFYPRRLAAQFVIHDYRSLSVGFARKLKDRVKALGNHTPDLRIFQNESIRQALGFSDGVPEAFLPMGVANNILAFRDLPAAGPAGDYCYIGSMLPERRIDTMIASFLRRYGSTKTLWLYGNAGEKLQSTFRSHDNVVFPGTLPQDQLFARLRAFGACVCYFPNHYPHVLQTPTKLLEYAALGLRIIANEQPQSRISERQFGMSCLWGSAEDMFAGAPDRLDWPDNASFDPAPMLWRSVIDESGVAQILQNRARA